MARQLGATNEVLETLDDLARSPLSEPEKAAIRFAERMTREAHAITAVDVAALRVHWSEPQVVEIACVVGLFNYLNRFAEALGLAPTKPGEGGPDNP